MNTSTESNETNVPKGADGFTVGASSTDYVGFYGAAPIVQPSGSSQSTLLDSTVGTAFNTLSALTGTYNSALIVNNFASIANRLNKLLIDLRNLGIIAGS